MADANLSTPMPPPTRDLTGRALGDFRLLRRLGQGGMGEVYLAEQLSLRRQVALKVLREELVNDGNYLARFKAEAMAVAPINHPNIVSVIAIGANEGIHYIALEYVPGQNLREYIHRKGGLDAPIALMVLRKIAAALQRAHEHNIVHRDIKPENVLLTRKGEVKVADFGLARRVGGENLSLTQSGVTMGTPLYMSPEQVRGADVDHRSDIYSLGVTAYHMLAGEPPYTGPTAMAVALQHLSGKAPALGEMRPDLPAELVKLVGRMMDPDPQTRIGSARDLLRELTRLRPGGGGEKSGTVGMEALDPLSLHDDSAADLRPANDRSANAVARTIASVSAAMTRSENRRWIVPLTLLFACLVGVAVGMSRRGPALVAAAPAADAGVAPSVAGVDPLSTARSQLVYAQQAPAGSPERVLRLWATILLHTDPAVDKVPDQLEAVAELYGGFVAARDYPRALAVADTLQKEHKRSATLRTVGLLLEACVLSRRHEAAAAKDRFALALDAKEDRPEPLPPRLLEWLGREVVLCVRIMAAELGLTQAEHLAITSKFWNRFLTLRRAGVP